MRAIRRLASRRPAKLIPRCVRLSELFSLSPSPGNLKCPSVSPVSIRNQYVDVIFIRTKLSSSPPWSGDGKRGAEYPVGCAGGNDFFDGHGNLVFQPSRL